MRPEAVSSWMQDTEDPDQTSARPLTTNGLTVGKIFNFSNLSFIKQEIAIFCL